MWFAIRPSGVYLIEDVHGINPLLEWILNGHKTASAEMQGLYYPGGKVGAADEVSQIEGDNLGHWSGFWSGTASRVQNKVENTRLYFWAKVSRAHSHWHHASSRNISEFNFSPGKLHMRPNRIVSAAERHRPKPNICIPTVHKDSLSLRQGKKQTN